MAFDAVKSLEQTSDRAIGLFASRAVPRVAINLVEAAGSCLLDADGRDPVTFCFAGSPLPRSMAHRWIPVP